MSESVDLGMIDLTKVARPDIRVKLRMADDAEKIYRIPGNPPSGLLVELLVLLRENDKADPEDLDLIVELRAEIQEKVDELFALRNAEYVEGDVKLGDDELATLVTGMFRRYFDAEDEGGDRPTVPPEAEVLEGEAEEIPEAEAAPSPSAEPTPPRTRSARRSQKSSSAAKRRPRSSTSSPT